MGKFGWDLPPGCTMGDIERHFGGGEMSPEAEDVLGMLEAAEVDQDIIDKVCEIVDALAFKECSICVQKQNEAEAKADAEYREEMERTNGCGYSAYGA